MDGLRKNQDWIRTGKIIKITPFILGDLTKEQAIKDGFSALNDGSSFFDERLECLWGLLDINHLILKKAQKSPQLMKKHLDWVLQLLFVIYEWKPLDEPFNKRDALKTITFNYFIPQVADGTKRTTIRLDLKEIVPGDRVWLCKKIWPEKMEKPKIKTLFDFEKKGNDIVLAWVDDAVEKQPNLEKTFYLQRPVVTKKDKEILSKKIKGDDRS